MEAALPSGDRVAERLRGFGPLGVLAILVIAGGYLVSHPLGAVLVLLWARWSCTPWREIGYLRPKSWLGSLALGIAFGCAFKLLLNVVVRPPAGPGPIIDANRDLAGNRADAAVTR